MIIISLNYRTKLSSHPMTFQNPNTKVKLLTTIVFYIKIKLDILRRTFLLLRTLNSRVPSRLLFKRKRGRRKKNMIFFFFSLFSMLNSLTVRGGHWTPEFLVKQRNQWNNHMGHTQLHCHPTPYCIDPRTIRWWTRKDRKYSLGRGPWAADLFALAIQGTALSLIVIASPDL